MAGHETRPLYSAVSCTSVQINKLKRQSTTQEMRGSWPATGYFVLPGGGAGDRLIVDAKPMGPDHLPAHGPCSLFSYELSIRGERLIVDSRSGNM